MNPQGLENNLIIVSPIGMYQHSNEYLPNSSDEHVLEPLVQQGIPLMHAYPSSLWPLSA